MTDQKYEVRGFDAFGNAVVEQIVMSPARPQSHVERGVVLLKRLTPWWAWNFLWFRTGLTRMRMITKITVGPE